MEKRSPVLFYSWSGNTRRIAQMIAKKTGADLREIQQKLFPALRPIDMDWNAYDAVYLGTPNCWSSIAPPVESFLHEFMPTDKTIIPFCTHGSGREEHIARDVRNYCIGCDVLSPLSIQGDGGAKAETLVERRLKFLDL